MFIKLCIFLKPNNIFLHIHQLWLLLLGKEKKSQLINDRIISRNCIDDMPHNTLILIFLCNLKLLQFFPLVFRNLRQNQTHIKGKSKWDAVTDCLVSRGKTPGLWFRQTFPGNVKMFSISFLYLLLDDILKWSQSSVFIMKPPTL